MKSSFYASHLARGARALHGARAIDRGRTDRERGGKGPGAQGPGPGAQGSPLSLSLSLGVSSIYRARRAALVHVGPCD